MLNNFMTKIFGKSWRTTFWGLVTGVCSFIIYYDQVLDPLPDYWENLARAIVAFMGSAGSFKMGLASRDSAVSEKENKEVKKEIEKVKYEKF